jgi:general secretion pathway protein K
LPTEGTRSIARRPGPLAVTERGIALVAVTTALTILGLVTQEFSTDATIDYEAAANARDDMRAHFLGRSGMNLARLVIKVQTDVLDRYRRYIGDIQLADYLPMFVGAFGGGKEEVAALGDAVGGVDTSSIKGLGLPEGEFDIVVTTDDGKINLNCANGSVTTRQTLQTKLEALFFSQAYDPIFQTGDAEGWRRTRIEQVEAILDYVDRDNARYSAPGTPEEYGYETLRARYEPKNNYLDSVAEARLIRGFDDRLWTLFGSGFTVYGDCKENVGSLKDVTVIAALIYVSAKNPEDPVINDPIKLWALARYVAGARNLGILFDDLNAFADFVKDPAAAFGDLLGEDPSVAANLMRDPASAIPEGVELDQQKLAQVARAGPRRTYRVEATASIGRVNKRIIGVWDASVQQQNARSRDGAPSGGKGAWVFWREE